MAASDTNPYGSPPGSMVAMSQWENSKSATVLVT
jgi:hypothetical protein